MSETRNLLYYLLFDNIIYNASFDIYIEIENIENESELTDETSTGENEKLSFLAEKNDRFLNKLSLSLKPENEDFLIDTLISANTAFIVYGACFGLNVVGSPLALPALLNKKDARITGTGEEIEFTINRIQKRYSVTSEQLEVLKAPEFKNIYWCKSALTFFCLFTLMAQVLEWDIEDPVIEAVGDFLVKELRVDMNGLDSIKALRICYVDTEAYFNEMRRFERLIQSESLFGRILKGTDITSSPESDVKELYHEIMVEFLNIKLIQNFEHTLFS